jgi:hypothetical protein
MAWPEEPSQEGLLEEPWQDEAWQELGWQELGWQELGWQELGKKKPDKVLARLSLGKTSGSA